ncbi:hypothetical protein A3A21_00055 [Candidatus Jorgensenbacteria bacterium RIFCSPLOWO2_01_FULL_45_25b]|uniref:Helix-turn-helix domain-containing protein n=1 Tax=Candidatus Jorgensenbacteria bacterium RIFCSPLOWO2_01_FULL_45_25b TaxID=1798471 RepID=A0A1F6BSF2_9BACT|nr:MAG: hypothetical protein A3A21_00055 [Candidatus Jorgensenbacteria bacterium RIFCSPLOWO2_01_FULL_45_25b]
MIKTYTLQDLEKILGVKERTLFRYIQKGWLKGSKRGKWRFTDQDIRDFLKHGRDDSLKAK